MKKSEILEAIQKEVESKYQMIRQYREEARTAPDWKKESNRRIAERWACEIRGIASVLRRLGFIDWEQMEAMAEEARKAAEAVGREEPGYEAC